MEVLKDYPKEFAKLFRPSFSFLTRVNVKFFDEDDGLVGRNWRFLYVMPCLLINYVTLSLHLAKMAAVGEIFVIAYLLPPFLILTQAFLKGIVLFPKISLISTIIKELGDLWRTAGLNKVQIRERTALLRKVNFCNGATYWISIFGTIQYLILPLLETLLRKYILGQECELLLPMVGAYPFDPAANWAVYAAVYMFQFYSMFLAVFIYIGYELILISLCAILGMEFTLLCEDMAKINPQCTNIRENSENKDNNVEEQFTIRDFVQRHQRLCVLSMQLDEAFNRMIFINLMFVGITTCFFRYAAQFSRSPFQMITNCTAAISSLLYVLYLCYYGELLTGASLRVGDVAYHNLWYKGNKQFRKTICIIILRSQKGCCLTSMRYAPITLSMFTKVMSSTWSYLSLMNTVYADEI